MKNKKTIDNKINKEQSVIVETLAAVHTHTHTHTHTRILLKYKINKNNSSQLNMSKNRGRTMPSLGCIGLSLCDFAESVYHNHKRGRAMK